MESFSKNAVYRFLNSTKTNWLKLTTLLFKEEIIRIYVKRWQIEDFFKTCKSYLKLVKECHSLLYHALTTHVAIVFTKYLMIACIIEFSRCEAHFGRGEF